MSFHVNLGEGRPNPIEAYIGRSRTVVIKALYDWALTGSRPCGSLWEGYEATCKSRVAKTGL